MSVEIVVRPHVQSFIDWARDKPEVVVLAADLTNSSEVGRWRDAYPDRFFSMGMAEQNMLSFAGGLARGACLCSRVQGAARRREATTE